VPSQAVQLNGLAVPKRPSILYLEDEIIIGLAQKMMLTKKGYDVTHVCNGEKALDTLAKGQSFDLVLCDINLGKGIDGAETARQILKTHNVPIVFMTSHTEKDIVEKVESISNYGYVVKNSGDFVLAQTIKAALNLFEAKQKIAQELIEHKKADEALRLSEEMFRGLVANSSALIMQTDTTGAVSYVSPQYEEIIGHPAWQIIGRTMPDFIYPEDRAKCQKAWTELFHTKQALRDFEYRIIDSKGELRWVSHSANMIIVDGRPVGAQSTILNITERKQSEFTLVENERLSAIGEVTLGVAHNFNNLLQGMCGNIELALLFENITPELKSHLDIIQRSALDAAESIKQLQSLSLKKDSRDLQTTIALDKVIEDAVVKARPLWKDLALRTGTEFNILQDLPPLVHISGKTTELSGAFYDLLKNSIEAMPKGGTITIKGKVRDNYVHISVIDTGIGMDEATRIRVFQPFFTTKGEKLGLGLGMSSVRTKILAHGGEIQVRETSPGKGTTIEVTLPLAVMQTPAVQSVTVSGPAVSARVLLVDDEEQLRSLGQMMLLKLGHKADIAASGKEALALFESNTYDLVITDLSMPGMTGWELAEQIRAKDKNIKIALLSGLGATLTEEERLEHGVDFILSKPSGLKVFKLLVNEAVPATRQAPMPPAPFPADKGNK
ncbi:MAG: response regulator, partial [Candidatus Margulisiibacteriota bacterium]